MPLHTRRIAPEDIMPDAEFARVRSQRRSELMPVKRLRRVPLGPHCTFYFEGYETMLFQVQEMLLVEKGGAEQLRDELAAYNPLIPRGDELVATVMFEIDNPVRRERFLSGLGGVEHHFALRIGDDIARGEPEGDIERSRDDGKTSAVHFIRFRLSPAQVAAFGNASIPAMVACDDMRYAHSAVLGVESRAELLRDLEPSLRDPQE